MTRTVNTEKRKRGRDKQKSIDSFFASNKKHQNPSKSNDIIQWREIGFTWIGKYGTPKPANRFAAFDLDSTLICTKRGGRFPKDSDDWKFLEPGIPKMLRNIHGQGYKIVIISNQNGLKPKQGTTELSTKAKDYRLKIAKIAEQLEVPFTIFAATGKDYMRKPSPGMWLMAELDNKGVAVERKDSFFVGDAAGRPAGKMVKAADFSDSDLAFAMNVGVSFYTPEEVFTKENSDKDEPMPLAPPQEWPLSRFVPRSLALDSSTSNEELLETLKTHIADSTEQKKGLLVLLVGPPASGKSTFVRVHLDPLGFEHVNLDTLKTQKKCKDLVNQALESGRLVVVDNTNPDASARKVFIEIAQKHSAKAIAVVFENGKRDLAQHNNSFRSRLVQARHFYPCLTTSKNGPSSNLLDNVPDCDHSLPAVVYNTYFKRFVLPSISEGLAKVIHHTFIPGFDSVQDEELWYQYY